MPLAKRILFSDGFEGSPSAGRIDLFQVQTEEVDGVASNDLACLIGGNVLEALGDEFLRVRKRGVAVWVVDFEHDVAHADVMGDRTFKLSSGTTSEYGRYVKYPGGAP